MATYQQKRLPTQSLLSLHWSPQHPEPAETVATRARETMVEKERMVTGWLASARRSGGTGWRLKRRVRAEGSVDPLAGGVVAWDGVGMQAGCTGLAGRRRCAASCQLQDLDNKNCKNQIANPNPLVEFYRRTP